MSVKYTDFEGNERLRTGKQVLSTGEQRLDYLFGSSATTGCHAFTYWKAQENEHVLIFDLKQESEVDYVMIAPDGNGINNVRKIAVRLTDNLGN